MNTVILVPRRDDNGYRDELWAWTRRQWEHDHPTWPIIEGYHTTGLFNRSAAVNLAAKMAGEWDVAVIIDADVTIDPDRVKGAAMLALQSGAMVLPHDTRYNLSRKASELVRRGVIPLSDDEAFVLRHAHRTYNEANGHPSVSSVVVVSRRQWDEVGGFDEEFRGWGYEDTAFHAACQTFGGVTRLDGAVFHFWHPVAREGRDRQWEGLNADRGQAYKDAAGNPDAIRRLQNGARPVLAPHAGRIPRILHRVVPEAPNSTADGWWARFEELHPDWELRTHRDPLRPAEWPLTREHWDKCANGAQFADLIRLEALIRWGGVYVDQDVEPFKALDVLTYLPAFAAWEDPRSVPNAVMGAVPDHPAMRACLELMISRLPGDTWQTGPGVMTAILPNRDDVLLLPPGSFYPVHYNDPNRDTLLSAGHPPWTFAAHHIGVRGWKRADGGAGVNVFSRIYTNNEWNGIETRSGPGSHREPTRRVAKAIVHLVGWLGVDDVTDIGCGEGSWMPDLPDYLGLDVAQEAIDAARLHHPDRVYERWDVGLYALPMSDFVICRDVVQHLSLEAGVRLLTTIADSGSRWLLASTYIGGTNTNIVTGEAYSPDLEAAPFNLPPALLLIHDGYEYHDGDRLRDPAKMLGLWRL